MANDIQRTLGDGRAPVVHVCEEDALLVAQGTGDALAFRRSLKKTEQEEIACSNRRNNRRFGSAVSQGSRPR